MLESTDIRLSSTSTSNTSTTPTTATTTSQQIYRNITEFLHPAIPSPLPPQVEILPPALTPAAPPPDTSNPQSHLLSTPSTWPLLISPPHIGIPKKALIQAFVVAREIFFSHPSIPSEGSETEEDQEKHRRQKLEAATVLLVFDPEHATAANYHREYFNRGRPSNNNVTQSQAPPLSWALKSEMTLLEGLLTSPGLDKHSKSPTLWSLRRWLVKSFGIHRPHRGSVVIDEGLDERVAKSITTGSRDAESLQRRRSSYNAVLLQREHDELMKDIHHSLGIVKQAGGVHPRNYHAWQYARFLLTHFLPPLPNQPPSITSTTTTTNTTTTTSTSNLTPPTPPTPPTTLSLRTTSLLSLTQTHFTHSLLHPIDTSIWNFLFFLLKTYPTETSQLTVPILSQTLSALSELAPPQRDVRTRDGSSGREAVWGFIRMAMSGDRDDLGIVRLPVARRGLLKRIEQVAVGVYNPHSHNISGISRAGSGGETSQAGSSGNTTNPTPNSSMPPPTHHTIQSQQIQSQICQALIQAHHQAQAQQEQPGSIASPLLVSLEPDDEDDEGFLSLSGTVNGPSLVPGKKGKPKYLDDENFAWRAYVWITRRGRGDWRRV